MQNETTSIVHQKFVSVLHGNKQFIQHREAKFGIASRCRRYEIQIFVGTLQSKKVVEHMPLNQRIYYNEHYAY